MKAAFINAFGPPENLQWGDLPDPAPAGRQVLVEVAAVAVNPIDTYIRAGAISMNAPLPYVVGCDLAGTVMEVGPEATRFKVGDRVWGSNQGLFGRQGTFAELAAVDEDWLYPLPDGTAFTAAAAGALVGITAHLGLFRDAKLGPDETIFVTGGTGGVGSTVIQFAKAAGAKVFTAARDAKGAQACKELGADGVVQYAKEDMVQRIKDFAPGGVNVWWETRREPEFMATIPLLAPRGRFILMAGRDARPEFPVGSFYTRDCKMFGFAMFNAAPDEQREASKDVNAWLADGKFTPRIDRVMPLSETAKAHQLQEDNTLRRAGTLAGKIVLTVK
jgi:NADPH2:quinone reductase